ncbi:hypothetical protein CR513_18954, partial [Mucuna pruriens]
MSFLDDDYEGMLQYQDDPIVIFRSLANMLYWATFQRLGLLKSSMEECSSTLIGFTSKQVEIQGTIDLRTTFGARTDAKTMTVRFTVVNAWASHDMILVQPTLNRL